MSDLVRYGSVDPIPFKATLSGVAVAGLTFQAADVKLSIDNAAVIDIGTEVTEATIGLGWYIWTPSAAARTQCGYGVINVKDDSGSEFDENGIVFYTGGDENARFNGT